MSNVEAYESDWILAGADDFFWKRDIRDRPEIVKGKLEAALAKHR